MIDLRGNTSVNANRLSSALENHELLTRKHRFEAIGVTAGALILDFSDHLYFTYLDDLKFNLTHRIKTIDRPTCANYRSIDTTKVDQPSATEVLSWLDKNSGSSLQPFTAFIQAFEQNGENATQLKVDRNYSPLCGIVTQA